MDYAQKEILSKKMGWLAHKISLKKGLQKDFMRKQKNATSSAQKEYFQTKCDEIELEIQSIKAEYEAIKQQVKQLKAVGQTSSESQMQ